MTARTKLSNTCALDTCNGHLLRANVQQRPPDTPTLRVKSAYDTNGLYTGRGVLPTPIRRPAQNTRALVSGGSGALSGPAAVWHGMRFGLGHQCLHCTATHCIDHRSSILPFSAHVVVDAVCPATSLHAVSGRLKLAPFSVTCTLRGTMFDATPRSCPSLQRLGPANVVRREDRRHCASAIPIASAQCRTHRYRPFRAAASTQHAWKRADRVCALLAWLQSESWSASLLVWRPSCPPSTTRIFDSC